MWSFWADEFGPVPTLQTSNSFSGPKSYGDFREKDPWKFSTETLEKRTPVLRATWKWLIDFLTLFLFLLFQLVVGPNLPIGF